MSKLRIAGCIPARYESSRFPGKPLVLIKGIPMVIRVAKTVASVLGKENTYILTDDDRIKQCCIAHGFQYRMTGQCSTGTDRIYEASKSIDAHIFLNIQGDEPLISSEDILKIIDIKRYSDWVVNAHSTLNIDEDPFDMNIPKVVFTQSKKLLYISRSGIPGSKNSSLNTQYFKQVCIYAFTRNELELFGKTPRGPLEIIEDIEILRFIEKGYPVELVWVNNTIAVDVPEDVAKVEAFLDKKMEK